MADRHMDMFGDLQNLLDDFEVSLLLTGSFSRGEESYVKKNGTISYLSDVEFIVFVSIKDWIVTRRRVLIASKIICFFGELGIKCDVSVKPVFAIPMLPKSWLWFETLKTGKVLIDFFKLEGQVHDFFDDKHLDQGDVNEVFFHSCFAVHDACVNSLDDVMVVKYSILKRSLDILIPVCFKSGVRVVSHKDRVAHLNKLISQGEINFPQELNGFIGAMSNVKSRREYIEPAIYSDCDLVVIVDHYLLFLEICFKYVFSSSVRAHLEVEGVFGERSFRRKLHIFREVTKNPVKHSWALQCGAPFRLFRDTFDSFKDVAARNNVASIGIRSNKKFDTIKTSGISSFNDIMMRSKIIHRYIK